MSAKLSSLDPVLFNSVVVAVAVAVAVALISESNSVTDSVDAKQRRRETMTNSLRSDVSQMVVTAGNEILSSLRARQCACGCWRHLLDPRMARSIEADSDLRLRHNHRTFSSEK
ncbi:hypothetical protein CUMW_126940 [Citrus unshiu]|uniref:Uncharacterized protein n=1 Tax=Citrus unshiu TaxID=55188 RepID=A0A2H5PDQ1_CITUN|nr:hypothetical protein CUMW_126940 [Citrus unshiu]